MLASVGLSPSALVCADAAVVSKNPASNRLAACMHLFKR
jgi:hypothetical protein